MCGIAGIYHPHAGPNFDSDGIVRGMLAALQHRGPDAEGWYRSKELVLGHRRLSIIDLSPSANQPLSNEDGTLWLAYNGEIYNFRELRKELIGKGHRFKYQTDSEVILHLYEEFDIKCLDHLRGMFAFALWDEKKKRLFLARDRIGIKPLYYSDNPASLIFASEARAIQKAIPCEPNSEIAIQFLQYGSIPEPLTAFQNIYSVPAGHYLLRDVRGTSIHSYWSLADVLRRQDAHPLVGREIRTLLEEAVQQYLVSDVPLGILLSGGLDSSSLVALAARQREQVIHTLTIGFHESQYDETQFASLISKKFGTRHHERYANGPMVLECLDDFFNAMDQPSADALNTFVVTRLAQEEGIRVLLSGLGGDEVFSGYPHFKYAGRLFQILPYLEKMPPAVRSYLIGALVQGSKLFKAPLAAERLNFLMNPTIDSAYRVYRGVFPPSIIQSLLNCDSKAIQPSSVLHHPEGLPSGIDRAIYLEFALYLRDRLLRDTDAMSMSHSLEVRVPFLDHQFVTALLQMKSQTRFHPYRGKLLLKEALHNDLPEVILNRPKRGFIFPLGEWLRSSLKTYVEEVLLDHQNTGSNLYLNPEAVRKVWDGFLKGEVHWSLPWSIFVLKRWWNQYAVLSSDVQTKKVLIS